MLHDKLTQSVLVPGAVKQLITVKLTGNTDGSAGCFRLLQLHRTAEQELLLFRHGGKPLFQPLVFGFGQFCPHTRFAGQKNNLYNGKG